MKLFRIFVFVCILLSQNLNAQEEYKFDLSEIEKKPFHFGGYLEFRPVLFEPDRNARFYKLRFYNFDQGQSIQEYNFNALLDGSYEKGMVKAKIRTNTDLKKSYLGWTHKTTLYEAFLSLKPGSFFTIDIGKKRLKWGKGYAWNPVAFIDKPKNPNDPELALEGFTVLSVDYIKSFQGKLKTITLTPVLLPVYKHINSQLGDLNTLNFGGKLYLLLYDTDIDFMFLTGSGVKSRYGIDFSTNITSNFEIHGEYATMKKFKKKLLNSEGNIIEREYEAKSYLIGIRFLTKTNTTFFLEYFRNGTGLTLQEMKEYFLFVDRAYESYLSTKEDILLKKAADALSETYGKFTPMRDYIYLRISQKEPFHILYLIPSLTSIYNINDKSFSLTQEMLYNPVTNLEFRTRVTLLVGKQDSEFGQKQNDFKLELRARYYF